MRVQKILGGCTGSAAAVRVVGRMTLVTFAMLGLGLSMPVNAASASGVTPIVLGLSPLSGLTSGGTTVTIYGQGFVSGATTVDFGSAAATGVTVDSSSELTAVAPAGSAGVLNVTVTTSSGTSATGSDDQFTYGSDGPSNLTTNGSDTTAISLTWTPPAVPGITGYTVYRNGIEIATTDGYTANYVNSGLTQNTTYAYTVTAQTSNGTLPITVSQSFTTASASASTTVTLSGSCPTAALQSGYTYILTGSLSTSSTYCLTNTVNGNPPSNATTGVTIDCNQHGIGSSGTGGEGIFLDNVRNFSVVNCNVPTDGTFEILGASFGTVANNELAGSQVSIDAYNGDTALALENSSNIVMTGNTFTASNYYQSDVNNSYIEKNTYNADGAGLFEPFELNGGSADIVADNTIGYSTDDGILLWGDTTSGEPTTDYVVANNAISGGADCGIESGGYLANTTITDNTIVGSGFNAICAYGTHGASWVNDSVVGNSVTESAAFLTVNPLTPAPNQSDIYLEYNTVTNNSFTSPYTANPPTSSNPAVLSFQNLYNEYLENPTFPNYGNVTAPLVEGGDVITGNNFGSVLAPPQFDPGTTTASSSNNVCQQPPTTQSAYVEELACPTVASVSPSSGPVAGGTTITVTGSGFKNDGGVSSVTVGGVAATGVTVSSDTSLTAVVPAAAGGIAGPESVTVSTSGISNELLSASASSPTPFTYTAVPATPTNVTASPGNATASVSFTIPANNGSSITDYWVIAYKGSTEYSFDVTPASGVTVVGTTGTLTYTPYPGASALVNGTAYTFEVLASNSVGMSPASVASNATTVGAPATPTNVTGSPGNATASVSFTIPANNGSAITDYWVIAYKGSTEYSFDVTPPSGVTVVGTTGTLTYTPYPGASALVNGTAYTFEVLASNSVGMSPASVASNATTVGAPATPTNVTASPGNATANVSFTIPASNGSAISAYWVIAYQGSSVYSIDLTPVSGVSVVGSIGTLTFTPYPGAASLQNETAYTFAVEAVNSVGASPASTPSNVVTPVS